MFTTTQLHSQYGAGSLKCGVFGSLGDDDTPDAGGDTTDQGGGTDSSDFLILGAAPVGAAAAVAACKMFPSLPFCAGGGDASQPAPTGPIPGHPETGWVDPRAGQSCGTKKIYNTSGECVSVGTDYSKPAGGGGTAAAKPPTTTTKPGAKPPITTTAKSSVSPVVWGLGLLAVGGGVLLYMKRGKR